jgi:hypothetical protein
MPWASANEPGRLDVMMATINIMQERIKAAGSPAQVFDAW